MDLGEFSISLAVKDLQASRSFYEKLGMTLVMHGKAFPGYEETWVMLQSGNAVIGLFQGMFEKNILTFTPTDVRSIQRSLKSQGVALAVEADESTTGPAHIVLNDPDGNPVMFDQHNA